MSPIKFSIYDVKLALCGGIYEIEKLCRSVIRNEKGCVKHGFEGLGLLFLEIHVKQSELLHLLIEGGPVDFEEFGGFVSIPIKMSERF